MIAVAPAEAYSRALQTDRQLKRIRMLHLPIIIIPDIQGEYSHLAGLLNWLETHKYLTTHRLAFLGDIIDGGYQAREVVDIISALLKDGHLLIAGNHECILEMACWEADISVRETYAQMWLHGYEKNTLSSYGIKKRISDPLATAEAMRIRLEELGHDKVLRGLPLYIEYNPYILVHAGILAESSWASQKAALDDRRASIMQEAPQVFSAKIAANLVSTDDMCVVSGHRRDALNPIITPYRARLDCGSGHGGPLIAWITDEALVIKSHGDDNIKAVPISPLE